MPEKKDDQPAQEEAQPKLKHFQASVDSDEDSDDEDEAKSPNKVEA